MIPYSPASDGSTHFQPALLQHGHRPETRGQMEARGIVFIPRPDLDGKIHNQVGLAFESLDFDEPGIFCEQAKEQGGAL